MPKDFEVFEPNDEHLAQIIVGILEKRGYNAGYQLGYPKNKIFVKVDTKDEANKISGIIRGFMKKFNFSERGITTNKLNNLVNRLGDLIPETSNRKHEKLANNAEKTTDNKKFYNSKILENDVHNSVKLEEWRNKVVQRLDLLNSQILKTPNDPSNEKRKIESDTLVWVLKNMQ
jgi:hypothetical protein